MGSHDINDANIQIHIIYISFIYVVNWMHKITTRMFHIYDFTSYIIMCILFICMMYSSVHLCKYIIEA